MEIVFVLLVVVMTTLVPVGIVAAAIAFTVQQAKHTTALFAALGARYGLAASDSGVRGAIQGVPVSLVQEVRGSGKNRQTYTVARAVLRPALDLGLHVRPTRFGDGGLTALGLLAPDLQLGDPSFDPHVYVAAYELDRVRALLTPELRAALLRSGAVLEDGAVRCEVRGRPTEAFAAWAIPTVLWIAQAVQQAALRVPPTPGALPYLQAFEQASRALGLGFRATPASLGGALEGVEVWAQITRLGPTALGSELYAAHPTPLGLGLQLRPRRGTTFLLFESPDIQLGDPGFDDRFDVRGRDAAAVQRALDVEIRRRVEALRDRGELAVDDVGVRLTLGVAQDPRALVPTLRALRDLSAALAERARGAAGAHRGAYR